MKAPHVKSKPLFAVIIVHFGNFDLTLGCLNALAQASYPQVEVYLVDNASETLDADLALQTLSDLTIVQCETNLGFAGGCNRGLKEAGARSAQFFVLLNNDAKVLPHIFSEMLTVFEDSTIGIAGPLIMSEGQDTHISFAGGYYNHFVGASFRRRTFLSTLSPAETIIDVDFVSGSAFFMRREILEQSGGLWEDLFLYKEETDLCLRSQSKGWRCVVLNKALVRHRSAASTGHSDRAYYLARNAFHMIKRHNRGVLKLTAYISQFAVLLPLWIMHSIVTMKWHLIGDYLQGIWAGCRMQTGIRPLRRVP